MCVCVCVQKLLMTSSSPRGLSGLNDYDFTCIKNGALEAWHWRASIKHTSAYVSICGTCRSQVRNCSTESGALEALALKGFDKAESEPIQLVGQQYLHRGLISSIEV